MFEINRVQDITDTGGPTVTVDRHLYLTGDKTRVVEENDPAGRTLWATPGMEVDRAEAERLGAIKVEAKQKPAPANKQRRKPEDKAE